MILAAQTTGGALGSMLAPAKIDRGLQHGRIGRSGGQGARKRRSAPGLIIAGVVGLLAWLVDLVGVGVVMKPCVFCGAKAQYRDRTTGDYVCLEHARLAVIAAGPPDA